MHNSLQLHHHDCFPIAFTSTTLHPLLHPSNIYTPYSHGCITDLQIVPFPAHPDKTNSAQCYKLDQKVGLLVRRNPSGIPISDLRTCKQIPKGWVKVQTADHFTQKFTQNLAYLKSNSSQKCLFLHSLAIEQKLENNKSLENTQPSLTDKYQFPNNIQIHSQNQTISLSFAHKAFPRHQTTKTNCKMQFQTQLLFKGMQDKLDLDGISKLCFPEGIKVMRKSSGFRFVNFTLTTDQADRYYCSSIIFSQKCSNHIQKALSQDQNIELDEHGLYHEKAFTLISKQRCSDQLNQCLEYFYTFYLSQPEQKFMQKVSQLQKIFTIDNKSKKVHFQNQDFGFSYKINTSYPLVSNHAIYTVFKFLQIHQIILVLESFLLEKKIFFVSESNSIIGYAMEAFQSFIYPLTWIHVVIPFISRETLQYTTAPMTIMCGLTKQIALVVQEHVHDGTFVFLDENRVQLPATSNVCLRQNIRKQLMNRLTPYSVYDQIDVRDYLQNPDNLALFKTRQAEDPQFDPLKIRNIFFELLVFMLRNYKDYFMVPIQGKNQEKLNLRKSYNFQKIKQLHKKDQFMLVFLDTSLFDMFIDTKLNNPEHKWVKSLDKAIKKICKIKKDFIQEESDNNQTQGQQQGFQKDEYIPKGCLNMMSLFSKQSADEKSPSPRGKKERNSQERRSEDSNSSKGAGNIILKPSLEERESQKSDKETSAGNRLSQNDIPEISDNNHENVVYVYEGDEQPPLKQGVAYHLCLFISYPVIKAKDSATGKWTKKKLTQFKQWIKKNEKQQNKPSIMQPQIAKNQ